VVSKETHGVYGRKKLLTLDLTLLFYQWGMMFIKILMSPLPQNGLKVNIFQKIHKSINYFSRWRITIRISQLYLWLDWYSRPKHATNYRYWIYLSYFQFYRKNLGLPNGNFKCFHNNFPFLVKISWRSFKL